MFAFVVANRYLRWYNYISIPKISAPKGVLGGKVMKKRIISVILSAFFILSLIPLGIFNVSAATEGNFNYTVSGGKATITTVNKSISGDVTIPETLGGYPVTAINRNAFYNCTAITSVYIPAVVTSIGSGVFAKCTLLKSITVAENNPQYYSLSNCLIDAVNNSIVAGCNLSEIIIPNGIVSIGDYAFAYCDALTKITLPEGLTNIGSNAFYSCKNLVTAGVPDSIKSIGASAFDRCEKLESINLPEGLLSIGMTAFYECKSLKGVKVPASLTSVGSDAFSKCTGIESLTLSEGLSVLSEGMFESLSGITELELPSSITVIPDSAFANCVNIENLVIPDTVETIEDWAFSGGMNKKSIHIGSGVRSIGLNAFSGGYYLESITVDEDNQYFSGEGNCLIEKSTNTIIRGCGGSVIPEGVTSIKDYAFAGCFRVTSINVPKSLTNVGNGAFSECYYLKNVYYDGTKEESQNLTVGTNNSYLLNATWHYKMLGDLSGDGLVDILDVQDLFSVIVNGDMNEISLDVGDFNGDGEINIFDVREIFVAVANGEI